MFALPAGSEAELARVGLVVQRDHRGGKSLTARLLVSSVTLWLPSVVLQSC